MLCTKWAGNIDGICSPKVEAWSLSARFALKDFTKSRYLFRCLAHLGVVLMMAMTPVLFDLVSGGHHLLHNCWM